MQSLSCLALALLQDDGMLQHDLHWIMICMVIIAAAVIAVFLAFVIAGVKGLQLIRKFEGMAERAEAKVSPMLDKTKVLVDELGPKVRTITTNVEQLSYTVRTKVDEFSATAEEINRTVKEANKRTQEKVARVDGMVNEALNTAQNVSRTVQESVRKPVQQIAGIIAGLKRGIETWAERSPFKRHVYAAEEVYESRAYEGSAAETTPGTAGHYRPATPSASPNAANETKRVTPYG
jgi:methyl-accepting chemotaxis protein